MTHITDIDSTFTVSGMTKADVLARIMTLRDPAMGIHIELTYFIGERGTIRAMAPDLATYYIIRACFDHNWTKATSVAVHEFGQEECEKAYDLNETDGEGCGMVSDYFGVSPQDADKMINAGRELAEIAAKELREKPITIELTDQGHVVICGETELAGPFVCWDDANGYRKTVMVANNRCSNRHFNAVAG